MRPERICGPPCRVTRPALPSPALPRHGYAAGRAGRRDSEWQSVPGRPTRLAPGAASKCCTAHMRSAAPIRPVGLCGRCVALRLREPGRSPAARAGPPSQARGPSSNAAPSLPVASPARPPPPLRATPSQPQQPARRSTVRASPVPPFCPRRPSRVEPPRPPRMSPGSHKQGPAQAPARTGPSSTRGDKPRASSGLSPLIAIDSRR